MNEERCIFLFTKEFPFGESEQYLVDEIPYLLEKCSKIIIVPCELFNKSGKSIRVLPSGCDVMLINEEAKNRRTPRRIFQFLFVFFWEWHKSRSKIWFWKERKRYASVLAYQIHLSNIFEQYLYTYFKSAKPIFYTYWIHNSSLMLGLLKQRGIITSFICRGHSIDLYESDWVLVKYKKFLPYYHFIIHQSDAVYSVSDHGKEYLQNRFPQFRSKFRCSRLGVHNVGDNPQNAFYPRTIVSCSNFSPNKNVLKIAEVISRLSVPVRWVHFGRANPDQLIAIHDKIKIFPPHIKAELRGFVPNTDIKNFYNSEGVAVFINLSEGEGIPVSIMEAISFGIPVLASAVYGNPEIAVRETGFCVPYDSSPAEIASLLNEFLIDTEKQKKIRNTSRQFHEDNYSAERNYRIFADEILSYH